MNYAKEDDIELPELKNGQLVLDLYQGPSHEEDDFLVWNGNRLAFKHITSFPDWSGPLTLIVGPPKSGKSHLAGIWQARAGAKIIRADSLEAHASSNDTTPILLENVDQGLYPENGLFHLLNQSMRSGRPLLMTARAPVSDWPLKTDDVRSRARLAAQFEVEAADDIQLSQMLVKLFSDRQMVVDPKVLRYVVTRMERSPQEAVALVALIDSLSLSRRSAVTRTIASKALDLRAAERSDYDASE